MGAGEPAIERAAEATLAPQREQRDGATIQRGDDEKLVHEVVKDIVGAVKKAAA